MNRILVTVVAIVAVLTGGAVLVAISVVRSIERYEERRKDIAEWDRFLREMDEELNGNV